MSTDKALTEALEVAIEKTLQRVGGPLFGRVEGYTPATGRAAVQPLVPIWVDGEIVSPPKLHSVPVCWPGSTAHRIHWPLTTGSIVELVPLGHDHSAWLTTGTPNVPPASTRRVSVSDLVALPLAPDPKAAPPDATRYDATWGVLYGLWIAGLNSGATDFVALAGKVLTELGKIEAAFSNHTHLAGGLAAPAGGGPVTGATGTVPPPPATQPYVKASVAATSLKAD